jgi:hypothetical protein
MSTHIIDNNFLITHLKLKVYKQKIFKLNGVLKIN